MTCCVVVPVYQPLDDPLEIVSFLRLQQLVQTNVFLVAPEGLPLDSYLQFWPCIQERRFPAKYFSSIAAYNRLMLSRFFYESFKSDFEWMLVHQLDAFLFRFDVSKFCSTSFDYFGAPWIPPQLIRPGIRHPRLLQLLGRRVAVGNGGLSLRRLAPTIRLLEEKCRDATRWSDNEDGFFAYWGMSSANFRVCTREIAIQFAFEREPEELLTHTLGELPMGCHAFNKADQNTYARLINPLLASIGGLTAALEGKRLPLPYATPGIEVS